MRCDTLILLLTGFSQSWGPGSGLWELYDTLRQEFADHRTHIIQVRTWDADAEDTAELVQWAQPRRLVVVGYSYGCGWGLKQLAVELGKRPIDTAFCIDPVPRWRFLPLKLISLTRWGTYELPTNVLECHAYRQVSGTPYGRQVERADGSAVLPRMVFGTQAELEKHAPEERPYWQVSKGAEHSWIDNSSLVHRDIVQLLKGQAQ